MLYLLFPSPTDLVDSDDCVYTGSTYHVCGEELRPGAVSLLGVYDYR